jgi:HEAT repeat protein
MQHCNASVLDDIPYSDGITNMNATPTPEEWLAILKKYAATGLEKSPLNAGASEDQLTAAEEQLKIKLPPSYRTFLSACNGWKFASDMTPIIRPLEKIRWFRKEHKDWYEAYQMIVEPLSVMEKDYFDYANQDCAEFEVKHLAQALCISEIGDDAVVLLNPMVIWPDGEWETWFFSNSSLGATRYRSFADWLYEELDQPLERTLVPGELPTVYLDAPTKPERRIRRREKAPVLSKVLKRLKSDDWWERCKATHQLGRLGAKEAVDALIAALSDPVPEVTRHAASSLELLHPPEALEALMAEAAEGLRPPDHSAISELEKNKDQYAQALLEQMKRGGFGANTSAVAALAAYDDEPSAQLLLKLLEGGGYCAGVAAHALAKRKDARAIIPMLNSLLSKAGDSRATWHTLTEFEGVGYEMLEPLMAHADVEIRGRAEKCIGSLAHHAKDRLIRRKAFELLQKCLTTETNEGLRKSIELSIEISAKRNLTTR